MAWGKRTFKHRKSTMALSAGMGETLEATAAGAANDEGGGTFNSCFDSFVCLVHDECHG